MFKIIDLKNLDEELQVSIFGKVMYFEQDDGTYYDRFEGEYISFDEAKRRLLEKAKE